MKKTKKAKLKKFFLSWKGTLLIFVWFILLSITLVNYDIPNYSGIRKAPYFPADTIIGFLLLLLLFASLIFIIIIMLKITLEEGPKYHPGTGI